MRILIGWDNLDKRRPDQLFRILGLDSVLVVMILLADTKDNPASGVPGSGATSFGAALR